MRTAKATRSVAVVAGGSAAADRARHATRSVAVAAGGSAAADRARHATRSVAVAAGGSAAARLRRHERTAPARDLPLGPVALRAVRGALRRATARGPERVAEPALRGAAHRARRPARGGRGL